VNRYVSQRLSLKVHFHSQENNRTRALQTYLEEQNTLHVRASEYESESYDYPDRLKSHNSGIRLSYLRVDYTNVIQTGRNRKLVFTFYNKSIIRFFITILISEIAQSKVFLI